MHFYSLLGLLNKAIVNKQTFMKIPYNKKILKIILLLYELGYINNYYISYNNICAYPNIYKNEFILNRLYFYSKPGQIKSISYKQLKKINNKQHKLFILSSILGICTSKEALKYKIGGIIIAEIT